ncbi:MAG TPA: DUF4157 domain-containing protein [Longimicrobium sp.]
MRAALTARDPARPGEGERPGARDAAAPGAAALRLATHLPGDLAAEREAGAAAGAVARGGIAGALAPAGGPRVQRKCACGGGGAVPCTCEEEEEGAPGAVQRMPLPGDAAAGASPYGVLVDDSAAPGPGQVRLGEFLDRLEGRLAFVCDLELAAAGRSTRDCPYLEAWLAYYRARSAAHVERAIQRYTGAAGGDADALLEAVVSEGRWAAARWALTGAVPELPEGVPADGMPPASPAPAVQPKAGAGTSGPGPADPGAVRARLGPGRPLEGGVRARMESGFGASFAGVRVHADARAARAARDLGARAFTVGRDVAFGAGEYRPGTLTGDLLLAHELAHTVQQSGGGLGPAAGVSRELEAEADAAAAGALGFGAMPSFARRFGLSLQRCPGGDEKKEETPTTPPVQASEKGGAPPDAAKPDAGPPKPPQNPPLPDAPSAACGSSVKPADLVTEHRVEPASGLIEKPGDKVKVIVTFACKLHKSGGGKSWFKDAGGRFRPKDFTVSPTQMMTSSGGRMEREFDGKKPFTDVGSYVIDGDYTHEIDAVKYGIAGGKDLTASTSDSAKMISPTIHVKTRAYKGPGPKHHHYTKENVDLLAKIIYSEIGIGNDTEQEAIAWAVRNQMIAAGTGTVAGALAAFPASTRQEATDKTREIADRILQLDMSADTTQGAIRWFSPYAMPSPENAKKKCKAPKGSGSADCEGGLKTFTDNDGDEKQRYTPAWANTMTERNLAGVRPWFLKFYGV